MAGLGESFRAAREARGLNLSDVGDQIHIRSVYLGAIENEDWSAIGAPVYVRGFIRTYARFLGLDVESCVQRFAESTPTEPTPPSEPVIRRSGQSRPSVALWIGIAVAAVLVIVVAYNYYQLEIARDRGVTIAAADATPTPAASPEPSAVPTSGAVAVPIHRPNRRANGLALRLSQTSWLQVRVDGQLALEGTFPPGTTKLFHGKQATLTIGNAGGVEVAINGRRLGKLGGAGDVVEKSFSLVRE